LKKSYWVFLAPMTLLRGTNYSLRMALI